MIVALALMLVSCGNERWDVKTLQDGFVSDMDEIQQTTISKLVKLPMPKWDQKAPRMDAESKVVQLEAEIVGYKVEADEDFHVVIRELDIPSQERHFWTTMVIEFPSPTCVSNSRLIEARAAFLKLVPKKPAAKYRTLPTPIHVVVTGVPFFDKHEPGHEPTGSAPNGVEIHPVLEISLP